jgi:hypothetical protein
MFVAGRMLLGSIGMMHDIASRRLPPGQSGHGWYQLRARLKHSSPSDGIQRAWGVRWTEQRHPVPSLPSTNQGQYVSYFANQ